MRRPNPFPYLVIVAAGAALGVWTGDWIMAAGLTAGACIAWY